MNRNTASHVHTYVICGCDDTLSFSAGQHPGHPYPHPAQSAQPNHHTATASGVQQLAEQQYCNGHAEPPVPSLPSHRHSKYDCPYQHQHPACSCTWLCSCLHCFITPGAVSDGRTFAGNRCNHSNWFSSGPTATDSASADVDPLSNLPIGVEQAYCLCRYILSMMGGIC